MDASFAPENCSVWKNEQMSIFREKCPKVLETSKNISSAMFTKILSKKSQLVCGPVGRRDIQELRPGQE